MALCRIKIGHQSPMVGAHWCRPIGWTPANQIADSEFVDGSWRNHLGETAGIIYFTPRSDGEEIEVPSEDLRIAACGEWRILGEVLIAEVPADLSQDRR